MLSRQSDPTVLEEQERVISEAKSFDQLITTPGWDKIVERMAKKVNDEITEAVAIGPNYPRMKANRVTRWDAMRSLLDDVLNHIKETRGERDRLLEMKREEEAENARYASSR